MTIKTNYVICMLKALGLPKILQKIIPYEWCMIKGSHPYLESEDDQKNAIKLLELS